MVSFVTISVVDDERLICNARASYELQMISENENITNCYKLPVT